jgi:hypothetical protein
VRHASGFTPEAAWLTVGQVADLGAIGIARGSIRAPSGERTRFGGDAPGARELNEQGFYEIREEDGERSHYIAVNVDLAESDLSRMDAQELVAAISQLGANAPAAASLAGENTPQERERRQSLWWYLLVAAFLLLATETIISNRLSKAAA